MAERPRAAHHGHRALRPASAASNYVASRAYTNNKPLSGKVSVGIDRVHSRDVGHLVAARPTTGRPRAVVSNRAADFGHKSARSNKFTNEFLGRGFYRDTTMDGQRRHEIRKKLDEERERKREMLKAMWTQRELEKASSLTTAESKKERLKEQREISRVKRENETDSIINIQSHFRGHMARRKVAKARLEVYDEESSAAAVKIQSIHRGRAERRRVERGESESQRRQADDDVRPPAGLGGAPRPEDGNGKPQTRITRRRQRPRSVAGFRTRSHGVADILRKKRDAKAKRRWIPSSHSPRPTTAPMRGAPLSPDSFKRTGGGFVKMGTGGMENSPDAVGGSECKPRRRTRRKAKRAVVPRNDTADKEVSSYANKRKLAVERAILMRVTRDLIESTKYEKGSAKLKARAQLLTRRILIKKIKKEKEEKEEWSGRVRMAEREKQRRILMAQEVAKPLKPVLVSLLNRKPAKKKKKKASRPVKGPLDPHADIGSSLSSDGETKRRSPDAFETADNYRGEATYNARGSAPNFLDNAPRQRTPPPSPSPSPPGSVAYEKDYDQMSTGTEVEEATPAYQPESNGGDSDSVTYEDAFEGEEIPTSKTQDLIAEMDAKIKERDAAREREAELEKAKASEAEQADNAPSQVVLPRVATSDAANDDAVGETDSGKDAGLQLHSRPSSSEAYDYGDDDFEDEDDYGDDDFELEQGESLETAGATDAPEGATDAPEGAMDAPEGPVAAKGDAPAPQSTVVSKQDETSPASPTSQVSKEDATSPTSPASPMFDEDDDEDGWDCDCGFNNDWNDNTCVLCGAYKN